MAATITVDWNKDGDFSDTYEDISSDVKSWHIVRGRDTELDAADVGTADITVSDLTGKYIPDNTSSVIVSTYGGIYPVCPVNVSWDFGGTPYNLFYGYLDNVLPDPTRDVKEASLPCVDGLDNLADKISMALQTSKLSGQLITEALDQLEWPAGKRSIDTGVDTYPLVHAEGVEARTFLDNIAKSEFGFVYVDEDGNLVWEDRTYRLTTSRCINSQFTCTGDHYLKIEPLYTIASVKNYIEFTAQHKTKAGSLSVLWTLQENKDNSPADSPLLQPGQTYTYWAKFDNIADDVVSPASTTDYLGNVAQDGSGADKTAQLGVSETVYSQSAKIEVTNNDSSGVYLTFLQIRGKIYSDDPVTKIVDFDQTSIDNYKKRTLPIELPYYMSIVDMQNLAAYQLATKKNPFKRYKIYMVGSNDTILEQILSRKISDRITLQNTDYNIDDEFYIDKIEWDWNIDTNLLYCQWTVSLADDQQYFVWDVSKWDITTRWGY